MSKKKLSKLLALYLPYVVIGLLATNLGEAWRLAAGKELGDKIVSLMDTLPAAFSNPLPSLRPFDCMEFETLQKIIAEVLDVEEDEITMDTRLLEDLGADSLDAVEIIMGIEDELGITVPQEELESKNLATVGDVYELINDTMA